MVLLKNLLLCREPLYGVAHWAARYDPAALGLDPQLIAALNDDRFARPWTNSSAATVVPSP